VIGPKVDIGHARRDSQALARLVGSRLVVIGNDGEPRTVVSVVGQLEHRVLGELPLHGEEPVLYARPLTVRRGVDHVGKGRIEGRGLAMLVLKLFRVVRNVAGTGPPGESSG